MIEKTCLVIDDNLSRVETTLEAAQTIVKGHGTNINFIKFNPSERSLQNPLDGSIDIDLLKNRLKSVVRQKIDLIACDYQLDGSAFTGLDIIEKIREIRSLPKVFIYSGRIEGIIRDSLDKDNPIEHLRFLVQNNIVDFIANEPRGLEQAIVRHILKPLSIEQILNDTLCSKAPNLVFKSIYPRFKNKPICEITSIIASETQEAESFKQEFINQMIDFMLKLNPIDD